VAEQETPFLDVLLVDGGFSIPELKWREIVFVGAVRREGELWERDPSRPLPPFEPPDLIPAGVRFRVERCAGRVVVRRDPG
jgi:hypothetical protein